MCNLASLALPRFVNEGGFDHQKLHEITYIVTRNLNRVIDNNFYPVPEARNSNMRHRPVGLGVQVQTRLGSDPMRAPMSSDEPR